MIETMQDPANSLHRIKVYGDGGKGQTSINENHKSLIILYKREKTTKN